jgi:hypothetical protein
MERNRDGNKRGLRMGSQILEQLRKGFEMKIKEWSLGEFRMKYESVSKRGNLEWNLKRD